MTTIIKPIRSFVRRERRSIQKRFPEALWKQYGLNINDSHSLIDHISRFNSCTLEIGFGIGSTLFQQAQTNPDEAYIGIEVYKTGIKTLLLKLDQAPLNNIRLLEGDAVGFLSQDALHNRFNTIQVLFPDPWPKRKHHKRRLIQPDFLKLLYQSLKPDGTLYLATDCESYAYHMLASLEVSSFVNTEKDQSFSEKPSIIPLTKFEERGERLGHHSRYLTFKKCI